MSELLGISRLLAEDGGAIVVIGRPARLLERVWRYGANVLGVSVIYDSTLAAPAPLPQFIILHERGHTRAWHPVISGLCLVGYALMLAVQIMRPTPALSGTVDFLAMLPIAALFWLHMGYRSEIQADRYAARRLGVAAAQQALGMMASRAGWSAGLRRRYQALARLDAPAIET